MEDEQLEQQIDALRWKYEQEDRKFLKGVHQSFKWVYDNLRSLQGVPEEVTQLLGSDASTKEKDVHILVFRGRTLKTTVQDLDKVGIRLCKKVEATLKKREAEVLALCLGSVPGIQIRVLLHQLHSTSSVHRCLISKEVQMYCQSIRDELWQLGEMEAREEAGTQKKAHLNGTGVASLPAGKLNSSGQASEVFRHTEDYRTVWLAGTQHNLSWNQSLVVKFLHACHLHGKPSAHEQEIFAAIDEESGSGSSAEKAARRETVGRTRRLTNIFDKDDPRSVLVVGEGRGFYHLNIPR